MNIPEKLSEFNYSPTEQKAIKQGLRNLSYPHRRKIYEVLTEYPEFQSVFFGSLLLAHEANKNNDTSAAEELVSVYGDILNNLTV